MRKLVVAAWLAASSMLAAAPAVADNPVSLPPLAPGEVLLEVSGIGVTRTPASFATLTVNVRAQGDDEEGARRAAQETIRRVTAAARTAGAAASDVVSQPLELRNEADLYGNSITTDIYNATNAAESMVSDVHVATTSITIRLRNAPGAAALNASLSGQENVSTTSLAYELEDDSGPRRSARADAVRRARADADSYAASVGMRVARVLRVTERTGLESLSMVVTEQRAVRRFEEGPRGNNRDEFVETYAIVGIDFALAPAR